MLIFILSLLWPIFPVFGFSNYSRSPSDSEVEGYAEIVINNNGDCGGYGGYDHSWWLVLKDDNTDEYYQLREYDGADNDETFSIGCDQNICTAVSTNTCTASSTVSCSINFEYYGLKCGDGGGAGATTADSWTLIATSTPVSTSTIEAIQELDLKFTLASGIMIMLMSALFFAKLWK